MDLEGDIDRPVHPAGKLEGVTVQCQGHSGAHLENAGAVGGVWQVHQQPPRQPPHHRLVQVACKL